MLNDLKSGAESVDVGRAEDKVALFGDVEDLRSVLNHLNAGVVAHAGDTSIKVCNPMACKILGLTLDQMIGVTAPDPQWMFLRDDGSPMPLEEYPVSVVLQTKATIENLVVGVNRPVQGDLIWALCNGYPVLDDDGEVQLAVISFIDITDLKKVEAEREKLEAQLRHALKMEAIGRLAGGVAHDFNNILTGINGYAELALMKLNRDDPVYGSVEEIRRGGERAADLTKQLLSFARKQLIEPKVLEPNRVLEQAQKMLERLIGEDIELIFKQADNLRNIRADSGQLNQILVNLAVNSRDAMPAGGRIVIETANVTLERELDPIRGEHVSGDYVMLAVSDTGVGFDETVKAHLFEPFFSTKGPGQGTGLGLSTVYGIVKQNDGFVTVYSEPEHGATFKLYFPAVVDEACPEDEAVDVVFAGGSETILMVEDDDLVRELARQVLSDHGYTVIEAANGDEALLLSRRFSGTINLLLSDVVMPGINGRELFERLRSTRPDLEALFMSGYTEDVIAHHGVLDQGTHFLQKPFTVAGLVGRVSELLSEKA